MAYQEGQRLQGSDGKTYRVVNGVPREEGAAQPAGLPSAPSAPGVIPGRPRQAAPPPPPPNTYTQGQDTFDNVTRLRDDYNADPTVKSYTTAIQSLATAIGTGEGAQADLALTYAFAKAMDPDSVVREAEQGMVADSQPWFQAAVERAKKEFGMDEAGSYTPEARQRIRQQIINSVAQRNRAYIARRKYYGDFASRYGLDPNDVLGEHIGAPFLPALEQYGRATGGNEQQGGQAGFVPNATQADGPAPIPGIREPTQQEVFSGGVQWDIDQSGSEASLAEYLSRNYGVDPGEEAEINAFWNKNLGNPDLTVEGVQEWYRRRGMNVPDADIERAIADAQKPGVTFTGSGAEGAERDYNRQLDQALQQRGTDPETIGSSIGINLPQGAAFGLMDEVSGAVGAVKAAGQLENPATAYIAERDLYRRAEERTEEAHPYISAGSEITGAVGTGGVGFTRTARASSAAAKATRLGNPARAARLGREAVRSSVAPGAATGAVYGFGTGEGPVNSPVNALIGAAGGSAIAPVATMGGNALTKILPRSAAPTAEQRAIIEAGERRQVPVRQADVRPEVRGEYGVVRTSEKGGPIVRAAEASDTEAMERSVASLAPGQSVGREGVGSASTRALERHGKNTRNEARAWYQRAEAAAGNARVDAREAVARLDNHISRLVEAGDGESPLAKFLLSKRQALLRPGGMTLQGVRDMRTNLGANIRDAALDRTRTEAIMQDVLAGASADIQRALAGNKKALGAYKRADQLWRERAEFRQEVTRDILGPRGDRSPGAVADNLKRLARDDPNKFERFWNVLEPDEQAEIASTFIISQGRDNADNWSPARFVSDLTGSDLGTKANISQRTLRLMFGDDGMRAIEDLRILANAKKAAQSEMNTSKTGNVVQSVGRGLRSLMLTVFGFTTGGPAGAVAAPAAEGLLRSLGEKRAARLLLNPDFTKWLKATPNTTSPRAIDQHFARLDGVASRTPGMATDVEALKQALIGAVNDNSVVRSAAAEPSAADTGDRDGR